MNGRQKTIPFWVPLIFGLMALTNVLTRPSFQSVRTVDAVTLIAAGMCFGAAMVAFGHFLRNRRGS